VAVHKSGIWEHTKAGRLVGEGFDAEDLRDHLRDLKSGKEAEKSWPQRQRKMHRRMSSKFGESRRTFESGTDYPDEKEKQPIVLGGLYKPPKRGNGWGSGGSSYSPPVISNDSGKPNFVMKEY